MFCAVHCVSLEVPADPKCKSQGSGKCVSQVSPFLRPVLGLIRPESTIRSLERLGGPALTVGWNQCLKHIVNGSWAMLPMSLRFSLHENKVSVGEQWFSKRCLLKFISLGFIIFSQRHNCDNSRCQFPFESFKIFCSFWFDCTEVGKHSPVILFPRSSCAARKHLVETNPISTTCQLQIFSTGT